ncbi:hypothetical protein PHLGIDRAFT_18312 [Phlebiopsis gigantea 11061_1 CR5-6]|uniref:Uncharacterized protein n=1 Tax=Phlebiopsis gigantea (strain 11061_1 CR5-6) TaxID=745531 RepID=A0A0C3SEI3_PHLG1|nr:hypothetical protein PHLGIDRAFT_18312 [Phlebiopsis gigantea 11061_1 CR5-6]
MRLIFEITQRSYRHILSYKLWHLVEYVSVSQLLTIARLNRVRAASEQKRFPVLASVGALMVATLIIVLLRRRLRHLSRVKAGDRAVVSDST